MNSSLIRFSSSSGSISQEIPVDLKSPFETPVLVPLCDKLLLELIGKLQVFLVQLRQRFLTDNRDQLSDPAHRRTTIELVSHVPVVFPGLSQTDTEIHESREAGEDSMGGSAPLLNRSRESTICPSVIYPVRSAPGR